MKPLRLEGYEFDDKLIENYSKEGKFLILLLAYNSDCNLSCPFCFTNSGKKSTNALSQEGEVARPLDYEELLKYIDDALELGVKSVCFYGEGEPLLNEKNISLFFSLVRYINEKELTPIVFTNGTMVDDDVALRLFRSNVSVVGKLYSLDPVTNESLTGNKNIYRYSQLTFKDVPSHIVSLARAGFLSSNRFALHTVVTLKNYPEIPDIWRYERQLGIIPYVDFLYTYEHRELDISDFERQELCRKIHGLDRSLGYYYDHREGPHIGHRVCNTRVVVTIGVNGDVRTCPATYVFLGNVRSESLKQILLRKSSVESNICFVCEDRGRCGAYRLEERRFLQR